MPSDLTPARLDFWCETVRHGREHGERTVILPIDELDAILGMARRAIPEPPVDIKAVMIARHNRVRVSENAATAVVDWLATLIMPEIK